MRSRILVRTAFTLLKRAEVLPRQQISSSNVRPSQLHRRCGSSLDDELICCRGNMRPEPFLVLGIVGQPGEGRLAELEPIEVGLFGQRLLGGSAADDDRGQWGGG